MVREPQQEQEHKEELQPTRCKCVCIAGGDPGIRLWFWDRLRVPLRERFETVLFLVRGGKSSWDFGFGIGFGVRVGFGFGFGFRRGQSLWKVWSNLFGRGEEAGRTSGSGSAPGSPSASASGSASGSGSRAVFAKGLSVLFGRGGGAGTTSGSDGVRYALKPKFQEWKSSAWLGEILPVSDQVAVFCWWNPDWRHVTPVHRRPPFFQKFPCRCRTLGAQTPPLHPHLRGGEPQRVKSLG